MFSVASMSTARKHLGCAVYQDYIYAVGGRDDSTELNSVERYSDKGLLKIFVQTEAQVLDCPAYVF